MPDKVPSHNLLLNPQIVISFSEAGVDRLARSNQAKTTADVIAHVDRAKDTLKNIHAGNLSSDEVFIHPQMKLVSLKVAREELNKAIALVERTRWTR